MVKLLFCLRRLPHLNRDAFQRYWRETHAPLVAARASILGIRRYVQRHSVDEPRFERMGAPRGGLAAYDGVAELWWDSLDDRAAARGDAARAAAAELLADERRFIDLSASPLFVVMEHGVVPGTAALQPLVGSPFLP